MFPTPFSSRVVECDCLPVSSTSLSRRTLLKTAAAGAAALAAGQFPMLGASTKPTLTTSESLVATFYKSLNETQRQTLCMGFDDPLRSKVDNNWFIVKPRVDEILNKDQQAMVREIFLKLHSPEYAKNILAATEHDNGPRGLGSCSVALFGEPGTGKFEFVLTGRHVTRRCDGDSVAGAAFGGPIFYGHAALSDEEDKDHRDNVYWYQAVRANEVFKMLDGRQRERSLLVDTRKERGTATVELKGKNHEFPGIRVGDLSRDQRDHVRKVMADLLAPFRKTDADEALKLVEAGGFDQLHLAFFKNDDIGNDGVWDIWQIEGPSMLWYFRGSPHVHTWVNIKQPA